MSASTTRSGVTETPGDLFAAPEGSVLIRESTFPSFIYPQLITLY